jgi:hypothetical protein
MVGKLKELKMICVKFWVLKSLMGPSHLVSSWALTRLKLAMAHDPIVCKQCLKLIEY